MENIKKILKNSQRSILFSFIFSLFFTLCWGLGTAIEQAWSVFTVYDYGSLFKIFLITFLGVFALLNLIPKIEMLCAKINIPFTDKIFLQPGKKCFWHCFIFIAICHMPAFLAYFPGAFTYDTYHQAYFFLGGEQPIEINPFLHNCLIYWTLLFSQKFNTPIWGVFLYTVFQSIVTIGVFAYSINFLAKYKTDFLTKFLSLLFFALYPSHAVFHLIATKDVLCCDFTLLFIMILTEMIIEKSEFVNNNKRVTALVVTTILTFMFRLNSILTYAMILPFILFYFVKNSKEKIKKITVIMLIPIVIYAGYGKIKTLCGIHPVPAASALSAPLQQMGRVSLLHQEELEETDKKTFSELVPGRELSYNPSTVDALKVDGGNMESFSIEEFYNNRKTDFWKLWLKWGKKYPQTYLDAFLITNYRYWYVPHKFVNDDLHYYLFTYNRWHNFFGIEIEERNFIPRLRNLYDDIFLRNKFNNNPILFMLFSMAVNTWVIILGFIILMYKKRYDLILSLSTIGIQFITLLFGPMTLFRYVYINFAILPLIFAYCIGGFSSVRNSASSG